MISSNVEKESCFSIGGAIVIHTLGFLLILGLLRLEEDVAKGAASGALARPPVLIGLQPWTPKSKR